MTKNLQIAKYIRANLYVRRRKTNQNKCDYIPWTRRRRDLQNILVSMHGNANSGKAYYRQLVEIGGYEWLVAADRIGSFIVLR